ncbi:hypothetical protein QD357_05860 [Rhizobium sp. BR 317]|uniref:hypothetical protein n=1 Tax=Rhizobium sp. BR 317 TaxID=3040015 RepID=UPI0039BEE2AA
MTDKSYTPIGTDFDQYIAAFFSGELSSKALDLIEKAFFAGAASATGILKCSPERLDTLCDELADHADKRETLNH